MNIYQNQIAKNGFTVIDDVFSEEQILQFCEKIENANSSSDTFRRSTDLFAIRQFLKEVPDIYPLIFNDTFKNLLAGLFTEDHFVVKSIYFDKPEQSNWFVSYHQDLTISVNKKMELDGFTKWTVKQGQFAVQPPLHILEKSFTVRIHLDDTDANNGALKVVPGSHLKQIYRPEAIDWDKETEFTCAVPRGGVMIMKPLLLHSSNRTTNNNKRRVIHIEFCCHELPGGLQWSERI
ncbi:MAG TPA: phytanoyl-CoA dioxygenase family protein [Pedobacter sp.]|uniref:phytanoyl-CoA dioxygenase family protein n=1 Tax=Pedobacter sp. TaxID=1411316 RepID=UPI002CB87FA8|nr:phytanoyl-CoA dioxygenase family protein [Pedobacter sp.]HMI01669.1 phytanoyl-CoA dioxygenase family protein [Pedobacter sp.]